MDIDRFTRELPSLYDGWGTLEVRARDWSNTIIRDQWAMTTESVGQLLNFAVQCLDPGEVYLEVGVLQGATLCSALHGNTAQAWAVDNWDDFKPDEQGASNREVVLRRLEETGLAAQVRLFEVDYKEFFTMPLDEKKVGVYFYDGLHGYMGTWNGLEWATRLLTDSALIVMDDFNWEEVSNATRDWIKAWSKNAELLLDLSTPQDSKAWYNGLALIKWTR